MPWGSKWEVDKVSFRVAMIFIDKLIFLYDYEMLDNPTRNKNQMLITKQNKDSPF